MEIISGTRGTFLSGTSVPHTEVVDIDGHVQLHLRCREQLQKPKAEDPVGEEAAEAAPLEEKAVECTIGVLSILRSGILSQPRFRLSQRRFFCD